jgi:hypothetical protein
MLHTAESGLHRRSANYVARIAQIGLSGGWGADTFGSGSVLW